MAEPRAEIRAPTSQDQTPRSQTTQTQTSWAQTPQAQTSEGEASQAETSQAETSRAEASQGEASQAETSRAQTPRTQTPRTQTSLDAAHQSPNPGAQAYEAKAYQAQAPQSQAYQAQADQAQTRQAQAYQAQAGQAQAALIDAGFRPARYAGPVRLLRRLVWPFVRPFHYHTLDRLAAADAAVARLEAELRRLSARMPEPAKLHALEARMDRAEARADAAAGDIERLGEVGHDAAPAVTARLEALEAGIHALRDARRPARDQEVARFDRIEIRLDGLEQWADEYRRSVERMEVAVHDDAARVAQNTRRLNGLEQWADGHRRNVERLEVATHDDVARMVALHTRLRSDLLALGNRHVWLEDEAAAARQSAEQLREQVLPRLEGLEAGGAAQPAHKQDRVRPRQDGVVLTATPDGVFLLKASGSGAEAADDGAAQGGAARDAQIVNVAVWAAETVRGRAAPAGPLLGIDVGAQVGLVSVALARLFDRVLSFEPDALNATLLRANVLLNGLDSRMEVRREVLAAHEGSLSLAAGEHHPLAAGEQHEAAPPQDGQDAWVPGVASNLGASSLVQDGTALSQAKAMPLDRLSLDGVAFIRIDAQGGEGTVLLGAMQTLARCRPWVVFTWDQALADAFAVPFDEVEMRLGGIGYRVRVLRRHGARVDYVALPQDEAGAVPENL